MIRELYGFGKYIVQREGIKVAFQANWKIPKVTTRTSEKIIEVDWKTDGFKLNLVDGANLPEDHNYYYVSGNDSPSGSQGLQGISPFYFMLKNLTEKKINKSFKFNQIFQDNHKGDKLVSRFFQELQLQKGALKDQIKREIDDKKAVYLYFKSFMGRDLSKPHSFFLDHYTRSMRNSTVKDAEGTCQICGEDGFIRYARLPFYSLDKPIYSVNYQDNRTAAGRLHLCIDCEVTTMAGWNFLNSLFIHFLLIPYSKSGTTEIYSQFLKIVSLVQQIGEEDGNKRDDIEVICELIRNEELLEDIQLSFVIHNNDEQNFLVTQFVPNFELHTKSIVDGDLILNNTMVYVPFTFKDRQDVRLMNYFDLERQFLKFITNRQNYPTYGPLYRFYRWEFPDDLPLSSKNILYKYAEDLFEIIYHANPARFSKEMINEMTCTHIIHQLKNRRTFYNDDGLLGTNLLDRINFNYYLRTKLFGEDIMLNQQLDHIQDLMDQDNSTDQILQYIQEQDSRILEYYLIGNLLRKIDNMRYADGNKSSIFENFIPSLTPRNLKKRLGTEILQRQVLFLRKLKPESKVIFDIIANRSQHIFEMNNFDDAIIGMTTGYYADKRII